jgi:hypothetical protein
MRRFLAGVVAVILGLTLLVDCAVACSCVRPDVELNEKDYKAWSLERAKNVVKGDIVGVRASRDLAFEGWHMVAVQMKVNEIVKGEAATGDVTLYTGFGTGDCGLGPQLLLTLGFNHELSIEVTKQWIVDAAALKPNEYFVSMCGYADTSPRKPSPQ